MKNWKNIYQTFFAYSLFIGLITPCAASDDDYWQVQADVASGLYAQKSTVCVAKPFQLKDVGGPGYKMKEGEEFLVNYTKRVRFIHNACPIMKNSLSHIMCNALSHDYQHVLNVIFERMRKDKIIRTKLKETLKEDFPEDYPSINHYISSTRHTSWGNVTTTITAESSGPYSCSIKDIAQYEKDVNQYQFVLEKFPGRHYKMDESEKGIAKYVNEIIESQTLNVLDVWKDIVNVAIDQSYRYILRCILEYMKINEIIQAAVKDAVNEDYINSKLKELNKEIPGIYDYLMNAV
ncbi:MAG: hypothetical protein Q8S21_05820 [Candidatus Paracaedibacteraceae bacterium]|nr:hypothetical protein [Candidatus Paracaedibacteraceae bacterium]